MKKHLLALAPLLFLTSLFFLRPLDDLDTYAQIQLGRWAGESDADPISYTLVSGRIPNPGWLAQRLFAWLYAWGGSSGLTIAAALLLACACLLQVPRVRTPKDSGGYWRLWTLLFAFLCLAPFASVRPQVGAIFFFSVAAWVLRRFPLCFWSIVAFALTCLLWQNCHPSVLMAWLLVFAKAIETLWGARQRWQLRVWGLLLVLAVIPGVCFFLSPDGISLLAVTARNTQVSTRILTVAEWQPPWYSGLWPDTVFYWLMVLVSAGLLVRVRPKLPVFVSINAVVLFLCSLWAARFIAFWSIAMIPVWAACVSRAFKADEKDALASHMGELITLLAASALFYFRPALVPEFAPTVPVAALEALRQQRTVHRVFNYLEWSGPIVFWGDGRFRVVIDGRLYLYDETALKTYAQASSGQAALAEIEGWYKPDAFLINVKEQTGLVRQLSNSGQWRRICSDQDATLFVPQHQYKAALNLGNYDSKPPVWWFAHKRDLFYKRRHVCRFLGG